MGSNVAISVRSLTKIYPIPFRRRSVFAVQDLNLEVEPGQVYGLLGPNGSGKSTTLKIILGLVAPTRGQTAILGQDSRETASRETVGFLPENPYFYKYLTGLETLHFFGKLSGLHGAHLRQRVHDLLDVVGLTDAGDRRLGTYSKGMLQRIGLAQALIHDPKVLILDEPTAGVDPVGSREICDLILSLRARGITILLSSHLLAQAQEICDRVAILAQGLLICEGPLQELISAPNQTELVIQDGTESLITELEKMVTSHGGQIVARRKATTTLEELFLKAIASRSKKTE